MITGRVVGSTATIFTPGLRLLSTSPQPVIVPPVPTPAHEDVDLAVGVAPDFFGRRLAMDLGVGRILELLGHEVGLFSTSSSALRTAPGIPSAAGVRTISTPNALSSRRRSRLMLSGMVTMSV